MSRLIFLLTFSLMFTFIYVLWPTSSLAECDDKHDQKSTAEAKPFTQIIALSGMSCQSCVKNVKTKLAPLQKELEKVVDLQVDVNTVTIDYSKNKTLTEDQIKKISSDVKAVLSQTKYKVVEG